LLECLTMEDLKIERYTTLLLQLKMTKEEYKKIRQRLIILWKALLLKDKMNTQTGKQIALEDIASWKILSHSFMRNGMEKVGQ
jgi:uncharacterized protein (DUF342 family)